MTVEVHLRFEPKADGCCVLCNPVLLADFEAEGTRVTMRDPARGHETPGQFYCKPCIAALYAASVRSETTYVALESEVVGLMLLASAARGIR